MAAPSGCVFSVTPAKSGTPPHIELKAVGTPRPGAVGPAQQGASENQGVSFPVKCGWASVTPPNPAAPSLEEQEQCHSHRAGGRTSVKFMAFPHLWPRI